MWILTSVPPKRPTGMDQSISPPPDASRHFCRPPFCGRQRGAKMTRWTAPMRNERSSPDGLANGSLTAGYTVMAGGFLFLRSESWGRRNTADRPSRRRVGNRSLLRLGPNQVAAGRARFCVANEG